MIRNAAIFSQIGALCRDLHLTSDVERCEVDKTCINDSRQFKYGFNLEQMQGREINMLKRYRSKYQVKCSKKYRGTIVLGTAHLWCSHIFILDEKYKQKQHGV